MWRTYDELWGDAFGESVPVFGVVTVRPLEDAAVNANEVFAVLISTSEKPQKLNFYVPSKERFPEAMMKMN